MPSAAILAGGRASRFGGRDKGALAVGGRSIRERQIAELARISDDILIVGGVPGARHGGMAREVADRVEGAGPLGGLDAALAAAHHERLVLLACDMPFVTAELLAHLLTLAAEADAVVPRTERGYHPLCAAYTRACQPAVVRRLADRHLALVGLFEDVRVRVVPCEELKAFGDPNRLFANVNTLADYDALEAFLNHKP